MNVFKNRPPVIISLNATILNQKSVFPQLGDRVKLGRNSWRLGRQRIKNKQMVHRMLKKEYYPYMIVKTVDRFDAHSTTLTVKPYNF